MTTHNHFVKDISRQLIERFPSYWSPSDFQHNKDMVEDLCPHVNKQLRNIIAGRVIHILNNDFFLGVKSKKLRGGSRRKKGRRKRT